MTNQEINKDVIGILSQMVDKYPDKTFNQILINLHFFDVNPAIRMKMFVTDAEKQLQTIKEQSNKWLK